MSTLEDRFWAKVNKTDDCWEWTGAKDQYGYGKFNAGKTARSHRLSWSLKNGPIPPKGEIDHICHNPSCVKPDHLRLATRKQNIENHSGPKKNCKSGVRGVTFHPASGKWRPRVLHNGTIYNLGLYEDLAEAEAVVIAKRNELHRYNDFDRVEGGE